MFSSTSLRLAAAFTAAFALAVAVMGGLTIVAVRTALSQQFDARIRTESEAVKTDYVAEGLPGLMQEFDERRNNPGELDFGVQSAAGQAIAGPLASVQAPLGWSVSSLAHDGRPRRIRVFRQDLAGGYRLLVADDLARVEGMESSVARIFAIAFVGVIVIGAAGGAAFSRAMNRRLTAISDTAQAIIDGDLDRRIPTLPGRDDLSRLGATINRMLDRIAALMEAHRQVSSDVAHDLRTPLNRHRQRLERTLLQLPDGGEREEIRGALVEVDAILATFAALLRISEVEAGAARRAFRRVDLAEVVRDLADDYGLAAEDAGRSFALDVAEVGAVEGDRNLLAQMTVNLIENALAHAGGGAIELTLAQSPKGVALTVRDHGPGVPAAERERVFERFYRLERSRTTPGSGLGLALVAAVARLHRGEAVLEDARPGLRVRVTLPVPTP